MADARVRRLWSLAVLLITLGLAVRPGRSAERATDEPLAECEIAFDEEHVERLVVPLTLSGKTYQFAIDTGSTCSIFGLHLAPYLSRRRGVTGHIIPGGMRVTDNYRAPAAYIGRLRVGPLDNVVCEDVSGLTTAGGRKLDGVLGLDAIRKWALFLDFDARKMRFLSAVPPPQGIRVPLVRGAPGPTVTAHVAPLGPRSFIIDTGFNAEAAIANKDFNRLVESGHLKLTATMPATSIVGWAAKLRIGVLRSPFAIDKEATPNVVVAELPASRESFNIIGLDYLSRFNIVIDFPRDEVYFTPGASRQAFRPAGPLLGVRLARAADNVVIQSVRDDSRAARFGLCAGDVLETLNEIPISRMRDSDLVARLTGNDRNLRLVFRRPPDGQPFWMHISDHGAPQEEQRQKQISREHFEGHRQ